MSLPVQCRRCGIRPAVSSLEVQFEGKRQEWHVCSACLSALLGSPGGEAPPQAAEKGTVCPSCGWTEKDWRKTATLGCPACYAVFSRPLTTWRRREGYPEDYRGPLPASWNSVLDLQKTVRQLRADLQTAIREERYEDAAAYRDRLKKLSFGEVES